MFCNEIEGTLFSPLPKSLLIDFDRENDNDEDFFGSGVMRNYEQSSKRRLLPSLRHFRSLRPSWSEDSSDSGRRRGGSGGAKHHDHDHGDDFSDEFHTTTSSSSRASSGAACSSPIPHHYQTTVKSLFHDNGCLFAYSSPSSDRDTSFRARMKQAKGSLSPRRRRHTDPTSHDTSPGPASTSHSIFRKHRHRFR